MTPDSHLMATLKRDAMGGQASGPSKKRQKLDTDSGHASITPSRKGEETFDFLALPRELRDKIYRCALELHKPVYFDTARRWYFYPRTPAHVLLANRQVSTECLDLMYREAEFSISFECGPLVGLFCTIPWVPNSDAKVKIVRAKLLPELTRYTHISIELDMIDDLASLLQAFPEVEWSNKLVTVDMELGLYVDPWCKPVDKDVAGIDVTEFEEAINTFRSVRIVPDILQSIESSSETYQLAAEPWKSLWKEFAERQNQKGRRTELPR